VLLLKRPPLVKRPKSNNASKPRRRRQPRRQAAPKAKLRKQRVLSMICSTLSVMVTPSRAVVVGERLLRNRKLWM